MTNTTACFGGTFDPVTNGHMDLIWRGARLFETLRVCVAPGGRSTHFTLGERIALIEPLVAGLNVVVEPFAGLLVLHARKVEAQVLLRGIRGVRDLEYEMEMAHANRVLAPEVETVVLPPSAEVARISSSLVREVAGLGGDVSAWVPPSVATALEAKPPTFAAPPKARTQE